jgi:hypothetical protein
VNVRRLLPGGLDCNEESGGGVEQWCELKVEVLDGAGGVDYSFYPSVFLFTIAPAVTLGFSKE